MRVPLFRLRKRKCAGSQSARRMGYGVRFDLVSGACHVSMIGVTQGDAKDEVCEIIDFGIEVVCFPGFLGVKDLIFIWSDYA